MGKLGWCPDGANTGGVITVRLEVASQAGTCLSFPHPAWVAWAPWDATSSKVLVRIIADMTLGKVFNFTERVHMKFEWQAFNVFNRANFLLATTGGGANNHVTFGNFGQAAGTLNRSQHAVQPEAELLSGQRLAVMMGLFSQGTGP